MYRVVHAHAFGRFIGFGLVARERVRTTLSGHQFPVDIQSVRRCPFPNPDKKE